MVVRAELFEGRQAAALRLAELLLLLVTLDGAAYALTFAKFEALEPEHA